MQLFLNGALVSADMTDNLSRALIISLFTWRRADKNDDIDSDNKYGWWGDSFATVTNDKIGSKLWLLLRQKITDEVLALAVEYSEEALQWMIDDGLCSDVEVKVERDTLNVNQVNLLVILTTTSEKLNYKIEDVLNGNN